MNNTIHTISVPELAQQLGKLLTEQTNMQIEQALKSVLQNVGYIDLGGCDSNAVLVSHAKGTTAMAEQVGGSHYKGMAIQHVEFCQRNKLTWCESAAIKYLCRHREKNKVQDVDKAIHYCMMLRELEYPGAPSPTFMAQRRSIQ